MSEPQTITTDHVRTLLESPQGARLVLTEGRVEVSEADDGTGALEVISRDDLAERLGDDPTDEELSAQADALTTAVQQIGG